MLSLVSPVSPVSPSVSVLVDVVVVVPSVVVPVVVSAVVVDVSSVVVPVDVVVVSVVVVVVVSSGKVVDVGGSPVFVDHGSLVLYEAVVPQTALQTFGLSHEVLPPLPHPPRPTVRTTGLARAAKDRRARRG